MPVGCICNTIPLSANFCFGRVVIQVAVSLGFTPGQVVQEFYYDEDVDQELRQLLENETGNDIAGVDYGDMVDGVIVWWRADDADEEDLADVLVDAVSNLDDHGGVIWVLTPKAGRESSVPIADVEDAAKTCGLQRTSSTTVGKDWAGMRLVSRGRTR